MTDDQSVDIRQIPFRTADGEQKTLADLGDGPFLVVNVASKCGLAPQYETLEELQRTYGDRGLTVVGFPSNQFMGQEPGSMEEILEYCSTTWGVTFPVQEKIHVNGRNAAPLYKALKKARNVEGARGPVMWNFEKFLVTPDGAVHRFRPQVKPDAPEVIAAIEDALAG
ncbi:MULTISPECIES: glutathione peroxidase [unclassified Microbacterium]|uniref:glutathione peroxidase n=1 Tax=unclassified Microbacterium TaxID=2609290 RepID=UPI00214BB403|nr:MULTISPECIES: glutathione peroxidase [unclassified Microbacterium]MCR2800943.1 glutathione peroxidase [Microbacterium sp. zg.Y818]MCR2827549.1 glutathione peroxidase [Microbacterium sp. zg.Y909]WIM23651.1 glutathione peroxidase [Microbacterium sp. zg-Y818]